MPQSAVSPITLSIDVQRLQNLVQAAQKSSTPQQVKIDIYLADAPPVSQGVSIPEGPHEVNRGAWAYVPRRAAQSSEAPKGPPAPPTTQWPNS